MTPRSVGPLQWWFGRGAIRPVSQLRGGRRRTVGSRDTAKTAFSSVVSLDLRFLVGFKSATLAGTVAHGG
jgi:hypothetical protein